MNKIMKNRNSRPCKNMIITGSTLMLQSTVVNVSETTKVLPIYRNYTYSSLGVSLSWLRATDLLSSIENDKYWKKYLSNRKLKSFNYAKEYTNDKFTYNKRILRTYKPYFIEFLCIKLGLNVRDALAFSRCLSSINVLGMDGNRYSQTVTGSYLDIPVELISEYFIRCNYIQGESRKDSVGYAILPNSNLSIEIFNYISELNNNCATVLGNPNNYLQIFISDFLKMSFGSQFKLLKNTVYVKDNKLFIQVNHNQDIGNCGRRYNILNEIPRLDRKCILNLYGVDIESALQCIVSQILANIPTPLTDDYIANKVTTRMTVSEHMKWPLERTKIEITAIYQGRWFTNDYAPLKPLFDERDTISKHLFERRSDDTLVAKYAKKRAKESLKNKHRLDFDKYDTYKKDNQAKIRNTFMFFYWTYYERKIQNVIACSFRYPLTLHDAVYTQYYDNFKNLSLDSLIQTIKEETNFDIKLACD